MIQKFNGINKRNELLKKKNKKEKKKFQKLSSQALTESLKMIMNNNDSKTAKMQRNFPDMLALNPKSKQKSIENGKQHAQVDKPAAKKLVHQKQELENILNNYNLSNNKKNAFKVDPEMVDSRQEAKRLFGKIISPVKLNDFFRYRTLF